MQQEIVMHRDIGASGYRVIGKLNQRSSALLIIGFMPSHKDFCLFSALSGLPPWFLLLLLLFP